jgi:hypothetical protein
MHACHHSPGTEPGGCNVSLGADIPPSPLAPLTQHDAMSLLSTFIIDPVVRQARRFSGVSAPAEASSNDDVLSHANSTSPRAAHHTAPDRETTTHSARDVLAAPIPEQRPNVLVDRSRRYSSFSRQAQDAVAEEDNGLPSLTGTPTIAAPVAIRARNTMPLRPSRVPDDDELRQPILDPSLSSAPAAPSILASRPAIARNAASASLSESLPADDGMAHLRARIHEIRDLRVTDQERARMVHSLMTERYNYMRPTSPSSFVSHDRPFTPTSGHSVFSEAQPSSPLSAASDVDPENPYNLRPGDTAPTYRPQQEEDEEAADGETVLGCQHYKRNVKVQCFECRRWYTCRHCHNAVEDHELNRRRTQNMLCMVCQTPQKAAGHCSNCQTEAACYYCDICKLWDNNSTKKVYHCADCGICRRGEGLGKDFYHCKVRLPYRGSARADCSRTVTSAFRYLTLHLTNAIRAPWMVTVPSAAKNCLHLTPPSSRCLVDTTCTRSVTTSTCKPHTSVPSARRALSVWTCNGGS